MTDFRVRQAAAAALFFEAIDLAEDLVQVSITQGFC
jgi:hypothetical protein